LLGAGDMLYLSADMQKPVRLQTAYIGEVEVKKIVSYIKQHNAGSLGSLDLAGGDSNQVNDAIMLATEDDDVDDDMYAEAKVAVEEAGRASTSYLQRKLRIGYSRAARLMDLLEEKGVIGAADGSRPRDVLSRGGEAKEEEAERPF
ncbi:MAG: cell division protein FtsK, partial [Candidatus Pacebacteria bacterium]|nr:cell division protein FtsK [Candidatus Paceibacterota bacterium]